MEGTALRMITILCLSVGVGCTTSLDISINESEDFSRYRTWDWFPATARTVNAPTSNLAGLDRDLARLVERELEQRGFERVRRGPDLRVGVVLVVRREEVTVYETGAVQQLSSLHSSPSYQIQASVKRIQTYERSRLVIFAADARHGRFVWQGALEERFRDQFSSHLKRTIASLMERFPPAGRASTGGPPPAHDPNTGRPSEFTGPPSRPSAKTSS